MYTPDKSTGADVLVIGGGAAGMLAALYSARAGADTLLLEKNEKLGKKLYITGKGRCNLTNACGTDEFLRNVPTNPRFLYSGLSLLDPGGMMALVEELGCPLKTERGRRVFPVSDKASDVTRALARGLSEAGCRVRLNATVRELDLSDGQVRGARLLNGQLISCKALILATGGLSYPSTGTTGDGYRLAQAAGHHVTETAPSLIPLVSPEGWVRSLQGLSLRNVTLTTQHRGKTVYSELGEMLFTHFGISGPLAIELSSHIQGIPFHELQVQIDLKPGLTPEQLHQRLLREFVSSGRRQLKNVLETLLPERLAAQIPALCGLDPAKPSAQITAADRTALVQTLKALPIRLSGARPIAEAIVTHGGVRVDEIRPGAMASKLIPNLFFAGELLDVDAHTGGYNLQIAFSTGALAGRSAAELALS